jgi:hypothetical protein
VNVGSANRLHACLVRLHCIGAGETTSDGMIQLLVRVSKGNEEFFDTTLSSTETQTSALASMCLGDWNLGDSCVQESGRCQLEIEGIRQGVPEAGTC